MKFNKKDILAFCIVLLGVLLMTEIQAGTGAIPSGPDVKMLKNSIRFKKDKVRIIANDTDSPIAVAKDGDIGSAYIKKDDGVWYKKTDGGATVNWQTFIFGAIGLSGLDNCVPRWDVGTGVLQDSLFCIDDLGVGTGLTGLFVDGTGHFDTLHIGAPSSTITANMQFEVDNISNAPILQVSDSGNVIFTSPTASKPLQLDGSNVLYSGDINATIDIDGILPVEHGGSGLDASSASSGQILIGNGTGFDLNVVSGTANQVIVSNSPGGITFSTPQDIHLGASPTFVSGTYTGLLANAFVRTDGANGLTSTSTVDLSADVSSILPQVNGGIGFDGTTATDGQLLIGDSGTGFVSSTLTGTLNQVNVLNGAGSIILSLPQDIHTAASPSFTTVLATDLTTGGVVFSGASSELLDDPNSFFWDDSSKSLSIGTSSTFNSAILNIESTSKGVLLPRMTSAQRVAVSPSETGNLLFDTDDNQFNFWDGSGWINLARTMFGSNDLAVADYDQVFVPMDQATFVSSTPSNILRIETGNDSFLSNGSFEHETFDTGWVTSGTATFALETTDIWEGKNSISLFASGSQSAVLEQSKTLTQYEGNTLGFTCMVKSDSSKVKLCTENGTEEKDCVFHDGSGMWKKMQAIMMVDSTGVMKGSVKNIDLEDASVFVDSCEWSNDPLKIKNINAISDWTPFSPTSQGLGDIYAVSPYNFEYKIIGDSVMIKADFETGSVSAVEAQLGLPIVNGKQLTIHNSLSLINIVGHASRNTGTTSDILVLATGGDSFLNFVQDTVGFKTPQNGSDIWGSTQSTTVYTGLIKTNELKSDSGEILSASDIVGSETIAFQFKGSGSGALDCNSDPVGAYTTYSKTSASNTSVQCAAAPTNPPTNLDGLNMEAVAFSGTGTCTTPSRYDVCIGKGIKGVDYQGYVGAAKTGNSIDTEYHLISADTARGIQESYNSNSGKLILNSGVHASGSVTSSTFFSIDDGSAPTTGYFHFSASKNPVINSVQTIPIVDYSWENDFSARIQNNGTCSVISQNTQFIEDCTRDSLGVVTVNFKAGFFTQSPSVNTNLLSTDVSATFMNPVSTALSASSVEIRSSDNAGTFEDRDFIIHVSRQGSDYKKRGSSSAIIAQPTCFIKHTEASGVDGGSCVSGTWAQTIQLDTLEGQCSGVSLALNEITLSKGTWKIEGHSPTYGAADSNRAKIYNVTQSSDEVLGTTSHGLGTNTIAASFIDGEINSNGTDSFDLRHRVQTNTGNSRCFGDQSGFGERETYATLKLTRIK